MKIGELKSEVYQLTQERDDAVHARTALEKDLRTATARLEDLKGEKPAGRHATIVRTLCEMLGVYPSRIVSRVRHLLLAERRLERFRKEDGTFPYPTTTAEREAIRLRPFRKRKAEA
jgi:hypothetical protein